MAVDLGTGDGSFVLRAAASAPATLWIGLDPVAAAMARSSSEALRRRTGNAIFVLGAVESLPGELTACASRVTVNLPWGSLLRAVAAPEVTLLANIASICQPGACLEIVYSASARDTAELARVGLREADPETRLADLKLDYADAGFRLDGVTRIDSAGLRDLGTTWAKRLWRDPERQAWRILARARPAAG
ncbi:MAG: class I SAM-dependent methyltransferase [Dehalococcoidia bacterium]